MTEEELETEKPVWVVAAPESIRGIYDTWDECLAALTGARGAQQQMKVSSREHAEAILAGRGVVLAPGLYAFTDGSGLGGVGVAVVRVGDQEGAEPEVVQEISTSVANVFLGDAIAGLDSDSAIAHALGRLASTLAELAGLYLVLRDLPTGAEVTIVHDYRSIGAWMENRSRPHHVVVRELLAACRRLEERKGLHVSFLHQRGHRSTWAGRHDLARFNRRADELATEGSTAGQGPDRNSSAR